MPTWRGVTSTARTPGSRAAAVSACVGTPWGCSHATGNRLWPSRRRSWLAPAYVGFSITILAGVVNRRASRLSACWAPLVVR
ncbi:hypothetical protein ACWD25_43020, partial [Streptomyces sp. NPDC002920]